MSKDLGTGMCISKFKKAQHIVEFALIAPFIIFFFGVILEIALIVHTNYKFTASLYEAISFMALNNKINIEKEETVEKKSTNMQLDAYIPSSFAPKDFEKITLYQRIEAISTKQELLAFMEEIKDNYGKLPNSVQLLFEKKRLDLLYNEPHIIDFKELSQEIRLVFSEEWSNQIDGVKLFEMMTTVCKDAKIHYAMKKISMHIPKSGNWLPLLIEILERTLRMERRV